MVEPAVRVAVLCGSDHSREIVWNPATPVATGNNDSWRLLALTGVPWRRMHLTPLYFQQPKRWNLSGYDVVLNIITDPDRDPHTLAVAGRVVQGPGDVEPVCDDPSRRYILTEFVEFRSPDGYYRKTRFLFVGGRTVIRHRIVSTSWNIHSGSRDGIMTDNAALAAEEDAFIAAGPEGLPAPLQRALAAVRGRMGLDYFGMDCALGPSGELLLFEANPTVNIFNYGGTPPASQAQREACLAIAGALADLVRAKHAAKIAASDLPMAGKTP